MKYGNFSGRVDWEQCLLEVESPLGKHFLQGRGAEAGLLENIIVAADNGEMLLYNQLSFFYSYSHEFSMGPKLILVTVPMPIARCSYLRF